MGVGPYEVFAWGAVGGGLGFFFGFIKLKNQRPEDFSGWLFSRETFFFVIVNMFIFGFAGGAICFAHYRGGQQLSPLLAINVGIVAPALFSSASDKLPYNILPRDPGENIRRSE